MGNRGKRLDKARAFIQTCQKRGGCVRVSHAVIEIIERSKNTIVILTIVEDRGERISMVR